MDDLQTDSILPPDSSTVIRPRRVWTFAFGAALFAALIAWGVEEASLLYYGSQITSKSAPREYRPDLRASLPGEPGAGAVTSSGGGGGGGGGAARAGGRPRGSPYGA